MKHSCSLGLDLNPKNLALRQFAVKSLGLSTDETSCQEDCCMLHIQGNLQAVFDALYDMGVIEPVLKMDWQEHLHEMLEGSRDLERAVRSINASGNDRQALKNELQKLDTKALEILAMEVAREFAEFHSRTASLQ